MAGAKLSARQKMINLMYLVFIAMLALNMGKKVLSSFGYLNEKLEESNTTVSRNNELVLADLRTKASEQKEKYAELYNQAKQIHSLSTDCHTYLQAVKDTLLNSLNPELQRDYESMDSESAGDEYFFTGERLTDNGARFVSKINSYRDRVIAVLGDSIKADIRNNLNKRFKTDDVALENGMKQPWIRNRYEGFPLVATLTNISVIQSDIKTSEKEIYNSLLGRQLSKDASIDENTYKAIVLPSKPAFFKGETFEGTIVLGRYDASLKPDKVVINGKEIKDRENGAALVKFKAGKVGENPIKGSFIFKQGGELVNIPVESSYLVIPKPNSAVVSADKMNVVYRGVENPITISMPGVSDNKVKAVAVGLKQVKGTKYILKPAKGKQVAINVSGTTSDGTVINSPPVIFRIKDMPPPAASIRGEFGVISVPKSSLSKVTIDAKMMDFDFDMKLKVLGFKLKIPGQATILIKGSRLGSRAQKALVKARRGDVINIFDVKTVNIDNPSYKMKRALPLNVEITN
jgi:gliding motility-associated protein GldM